MAKPLIQVFSEQEKCCCVHGYINQPQYVKLTNAQMAKRLGLSQRTVTDFRAQDRSGGYPCKHAPNCKEKK